MSLKIKILLIVILPLGAYFFVSLSTILTGYKQFNSYNQIYEFSKLSANISSLVHELQKERGAPVVFFVILKIEAGVRLMRLIVTSDVVKQSIAASLLSKVPEICLLFSDIFPAGHHVLYESINY